MTGAELKTFVEDGLLDGQTINDIFFYQLLNVAKEKIENERNWKVLEKDDSTQTASSGDTFLSMKTLPTDFGNDIGLFVTDGNNNPITYLPIPFSNRYIHKDSSRRYYVDLANSRFALTGKLSSGYTTIHLIYRYSSSDIDSGSSWAFPSRFHAILGFLVAEMWRGGVDYDDVNARNLLQNRTDGLALYNSLIDWDSALRIQEQGHSYEEQGQYGSDGLPEGDVQNFPLSLM